jgi:hypothetical protein
MIRSLVLFTHVVAVIALAVGLVLEWFALNAVQLTTTREEGLRWVKLNVASQRELGIAFGATLLSGLYLSGLGVLGRGWMLASYAAILLIGGSGIVAFAPDGRPFSVVGFTARGTKLVEIDVLADPDRLARFDLAVYR